MALASTHLGGGVSLNSMQTILTEALFLALVLSIIPMVAISLAAGTVTLLQAITQLQDQSLVHLSRLAAMGAMIACGGSAAFAALEELFVKVVSLARLHYGI